MLRRMVAPQVQCMMQLDAATACSNQMQQQIVARNRTWADSRRQQITGTKGTAQDVAIGSTTGVMAVVMIEIMVEIGSAVEAAVAAGSATGGRRPTIEAGTTGATDTKTGTGAVTCERTCERTCGGTLTGPRVRRLAAALPLLLGLGLVMLAAGLAEHHIAATTGRHGW